MRPVINVNLPPELAIVVFALTFLLGAIINIAFAFAVASDAGRLPRGRRPVFVGSTIWFLATLFGGPFLAAVYWVLHHSTISPYVYCDCKRELSEPLGPSESYKQ